MRDAFVLFLGLGAGILTGLMGIGGGSIIVPLMVYLLSMNEYAAQGTSLFIQLLPIGLGALWVYWKKGAVDLRAGIACAVGFLPGGYLGGRVALAISSHNLQGLFGLFLVFSAVMLWWQPGAKSVADGASGAPNKLTRGGRLAGILAMSVVVGTASGLFGIGGGILLVPILVLLFGFEEHRAQGTSLIALVPPTGFFGVLAYYHAHQVDLKIALLLTPGFFLGGILGGKLAARLSSRWMRVVFAGLLFLLGVFQGVTVWMNR